MLMMLGRAGVAKTQSIKQEAKCLLSSYRSRDYTILIFEFVIDLYLCGVLISNRVLPGN